MGEDSARRLPEDSQKKSSSALNVRRLPRRLPWKSSKSVSDLKKPTYPKVFKLLQNIVKLQK